MSLTAWDLLTEPRWVGLANYTALLQDSLFQTSLRNTVLFVALDAPLAVVIPLGAVLLPRRLEQQRLAREAVGGRQRQRGHDRLRAFGQDRAQP